MMPPIMGPEIFTAIRPQGRAAFGHSCNCSCMRLGQRVAAWPQTIARVGIRFAETIQKNVAKIWFAPLQPNRLELLRDGGMHRHGARLAVFGAFEK